MKRTNINFNKIQNKQQVLAINKQSDQSSRNMMPEELIKMSSQFKRDMRKLNMMKEVKVLIEN